MLFLKQAGIALSVALVLSACSLGERIIDNAPAPASSSAASSSKVPSSPTPRSSSLASSSSSAAPYVGPFRFDPMEGYQGTITVTGYPEIEMHEEGFCDTTTEDCETFAYVYFRVTDGLSDLLRAYLVDLKGNTFVSGDDGIGIGCKVAPDAIRVDPGYSVGSPLPADVSVAILNATKERPVSLTLMHPTLTGGTDANDCYSHFRVDAVR